MADLSCSFLRKAWCWKSLVKGKRCEGCGSMERKGDMWGDVGKTGALTPSEQNPDACKPAALRASTAILFEKRLATEANAACMRWWSEKGKFQKDSSGLGLPSTNELLEAFLKRPLPRSDRWREQ